MINQSHPDRLWVQLLSPWDVGLDRAPRPAELMSLFHPPSLGLILWPKPLTPACLVFQFHALSSPQSPFPTTPTSRRALHRTLSDESIYSSQREHFFTSRASLLDQALPNDVLFSSTYPSLPKSLPLRRPSYTLGMKSLHGKCPAVAAWQSCVGPMAQYDNQPFVFLGGSWRNFYLSFIFQPSLPPVITDHCSPQHCLS
jgi:hypothetical protein